MNIVTGKVTDCGLWVLRTKIAGLNKRAARLNLPPLTVVIVGEETIRGQHECGLPTYVHLYEVRVEGEAPRINGWMVAARIEFTEVGNFVVTAPGVENLRQEWREVGNECQHCHTKRKRNDLIVIRHEDGREIIVGRNCLADYIRTGDAESLLAYANWMSISLECSAEEEKEYYGGGRVEILESVKSVLQFASLCIRKFGWVSRKVADECQKESTASQVRTLMNPPNNAIAYADWQKWIKANNLYATDNDTNEAEKAMEWMQSIPANSNSEYLYNLHIVSQLEQVPSNKIGLVVSAVPSAMRARDEEVKRQEFRKGNANKGFMGNVKERLKGLEVIVKRVTSVDSFYGVVTVITFACGDNDLTWFATGDVTESYEPGSTLVIDATVKAHRDDPKYGKSTLVNRVKVKEVAV